MTRRQETIVRDFDGCDACYMENRGWGGIDCCEVCSWQNYTHTCETPA